MENKVGEDLNKVFCNKETNMVEQILKEEEGEIIREDYFPNCYMIEDLEGRINAYNLRYNKETKEFEVVEGLPAIDIPIVIRTPTSEDFNNLKQENEELKDRLDNLEALIKRISEVE